MVWPTLWPNSKSHGLNDQPRKEHLLCPRRCSHCVKRKWIEARKISREGTKKFEWWKSSVENIKKWILQKSSWLSRPSSIRVGGYTKIDKSRNHFIQNLNIPKLLMQLGSFLGSINHLAKIISNAASLTDKLRALIGRKIRRKSWRTRNYQWKNSSGAQTHSHVWLDEKHSS